METPLLKAADVARVLGIGRATAYALMASGELPTIRIGRSVRIPEEALKAWLERKTAGTGGRDDDEQQG